MKISKIDSLTSHSRVIREFIKTAHCDDCQKQFRKISDLKRHIKTHKDKREFQCAECNMSFKLKQTLTRHMTTHSKSIFTCSVCFSSYKSAKTLSNHFDKIHNRGPTILSTSQLIRTQSTSSNAGDDTAKSEKKKLDTLPYNFNQTPTISFPTQNPNSGTSSSSWAIVRYAEDMQAKRQQSGKSCPVCKKSFTKPIDLRRHFDSVHERKRLFSCPIEGCGKSFSLKVTNNRHTVTHVDKSNRKYVECDICHKELSTKSSLRLHQRIHDNSKPFSCHLCCLTYRTAGNLKSHMKTHQK